MMKKEIEFALVSFMFVAVTDFADGWIARSTKQSTKFGELIDPLADKFMVALAVIALIIKFDFPFYAVPLILMRDVVSLVGGIILHGRNVRTWKPKLLGKLTTFFQIATVVGFMIGFEYSIAIVWLTALLSMTTSVVYFLKGVKILSGKSD